MQIEFEGLGIVFFSVEKGELKIDTIRTDDGELIEFASVPDPLQREIVTIVRDVLQSAPDSSIQ